MDQFTNPNTAVAFLVWLLLVILNGSTSPQFPSAATVHEEDDDNVAAYFDAEEGSAFNTLATMQTTVQNFRLCTALNVFHDEMDFWVKPRSTTWFSKFLVHEYDNSRWISMFRMTKPAVFALAEVIRPQIQKKDTNYRLAVPVVVRVACTLFKLTHAANFTICSEMFAIGRSTVSKILREVVHAINDSLRQEIRWPTGEKLQDTQMKFFALCSLPAVVGAVDGVHISITKPRVTPADYFYFKTGGYSMNCQAVVDSEKRFLDLYVGMPGSTNDSRMLRRSSLYHLATQRNLLVDSESMQGFSPYIVGDSGYPLLPWLMIPHRDGGHLSIAESLFNRKLKKGRCVVENAFGILKQTFRELLGKSELQITFLLDVIVCCCILHNILLRQSHEEVEELLHVLQSEGLEVADNDEVMRVPLRAGFQAEDMSTTEGALKRSDLGFFLTTQRRMDTPARRAGADQNDGRRHARPVGEESSVDM